MPPRSGLTRSRTSPAAFLNVGVPGAYPNFVATICAASPTVMPFGKLNGTGSGCRGENTVTSSVDVPLAADERKCGLRGDQEEEEADWLSGEMVIPYDGALRLARMDASDADAASNFDVSLAVARWRMNHSGARNVVRRVRAKRRSRD